MLALLIPVDVYENILPRGDGGRRSVESGWREPRRPDGEGTVVVDCEGAGKRTGSDRERDSEGGEFHHFEMRGGRGLVSGKRRRG